VKRISAPSIPDPSAGIRLRRRAIYTASKPSSGLTTLSIAGIVITALYFARDIFIPLALAVLLSFALGPLVMGLRRMRVPRAPAVIAVVLLAFIGMVGIGTLIGSQLTQLAEELPRYRLNITQKIQSIKDIGAGGGVVARTTALLDQLGTELMKPPESVSSLPAPKPRTPPPKPPLLVEIHEAAATPLAIMMNVIVPLLQPFATAGIVTVFVIFFLLQREHLRDRFIRLVGPRDLRHTTEALDDAFSRLGRYLLTQTVINSIFGMVIGFGLWLIGVPNPVLWGALAVLLRFVPFIGSVIAASFPAALALAVDQGWSMLVWTAALFVVAETITSQIVEPYYYGRSTGLSTVAVVVATTFWTWLWGPIGLLLSMPLTLCLIVLGRHVAALEFLDILLGDEPALTAEEKFYQRMLAGDSEDAAYQAEDFLRTKPLAEYYDEVAVKGLALAQLDVNRGELDHARRLRIKEAVDAVIDDLSDHAAPLTEDDPATDSDAGGGSQNVVLCVSGRGSLDEAVAAMLGQLLGKAGIGVRVVASGAVTALNLTRLDVIGVRMVFVSYLEPGDFTNARYLVRRLRRRLPDALIVAGFWTLSEADALAREAARETTADLVVTSLRQAIDRVTAVAGHESPRTDAPDQTMAALQTVTARPDGGRDRD
jgi:predicted PurR-regulated permease PerM